VAVVVDDLSSLNAGSGEIERRPWSESEIQRLTVLVRDAVGYSAARGDSINVINAPFRALEPLEPLPEEEFWKLPWFWDLMKKVGAGVFLLLLVFGVLRPIMKNLAAAGVGGAPVTASDVGGELQGIEEAALPSGGQIQGLGGADTSLLPGPNESYERQMSAVRSLVASDPGRVAQVVKQWVSADE
jgi:flagellar M-ring protein FliF